MQTNRLNLRQEVNSGMAVETFEKNSANQKNNMVLLVAATTKGTSNDCGWTCDDVNCECNIN